MISKCLKIFFLPLQRTGILLVITNADSTTQQPTSPVAKRPLRRRPFHRSWLPTGDSQTSGPALRTWEHARTSLRHPAKIARHLYMLSGKFKSNPKLSILQLLFLLMVNTPAHIQLVRVLYFCQKNNIIRRLSKDLYLLVSALSGVLEFWPPVFFVAAKWRVRK